jgi:hypothetical protein
MRLRKWYIFCCVDALEIGFEIVYEN